MARALPEPHLVALVLLVVAGCDSAAQPGEGGDASDRGAGGGGDGAGGTGGGVCVDPGAELDWRVTAPDGTVVGPGVGDEEPVLVDLTGEVVEATVGTLIVIDRQAEPPGEVRVAIADRDGPVDLRIASGTQVRVRIETDDPDVWPGASPGWIVRLRVDGAGEDAASGLLLFAGDVHARETSFTLDASPVVVVRDDDGWCELVREDQLSEYQFSLLVSDASSPDVTPLEEGSSIVVDVPEAGAFEITAFNTTSTHEGLSPLDALVRRAR